jgi:hypothetical protein
VAFVPIRVHLDHLQNESKELLATEERLKSGTYDGRQFRKQRSDVDADKVAQKFSYEGDGMNQTNVAETKETCSQRSNSESPGRMQSTRMRLPAFGRGTGWCSTFRGQACFQGTEVF